MFWFSSFFFFFFSYTWEENNNTVKKKKKSYDKLNWWGSCGRITTKKLPYWLVSPEEDKAEQLWHTRNIEFLNIKKKKI